MQFFGKVVRCSNKECGMPVFKQVAGKLLTDSDITDLLTKGKTRYRTKIKHTLQAIARCAWINMRRLFLYDLEMGLQMATK